MDLNAAAPIMILPAEIRAIIYSQMAPIDQFKVDCFDEFVAIFNPYNDRPTSCSPIIVELYKDVHFDNRSDAYPSDYIKHLDVMKWWDTVVAGYCNNSCCGGCIKLNVCIAITWCCFDNYYQKSIPNQEHIVATKCCLSYITKYFKRNYEKCATTDKYLLNIAKRMFYMLIDIISKSMFVEYNNQYLEIYIKYFASSNMYHDLSTRRDSVLAIYMRDINIICNDSPIVPLLTDGYPKFAHSWLGTRIIFSIFESQVLHNIYP